MIIRSKKPPFVEFEVFTDEEISKAYRAIHEAHGLPWGKAMDENRYFTGAVKTVPVRRNRNSPPVEIDHQKLKSVLATLADICWSYDIAALQVIHQGRTRRKVIEKYLAGHSFNKFEPRIARVAVALGTDLSALLAIEKLGDGLTRETWFSAGPLLAAVPVNDLTRLEVELRQKEQGEIVQDLVVQTIQP